MAMTTADCLRIYEAMKVADRKLMINFSIRFSGGGAGDQETVALARR